MGSTVIPNFFDTKSRLVKMTVEDDNSPVIQASVKGEFLPKGSSLSIPIHAVTDSLGSFSVVLGEGNYSHF